MNADACVCPLFIMRPHSVEMDSALVVSEQRSREPQGPPGPRVGRAGGYKNRAFRLTFPRKLCMVCTAKEQSLRFTAQIVFLHIRYCQ